MGLVRGWSALSPQQRPARPCRCPLRPARRVPGTGATGTKVATDSAESIRTTPLGGEMQATGPQRAGGCGRENPGAQCPMPGHRGTGILSWRCSVRVWDWGSRCGVTEKGVFGHPPQGGGSMKRIIAGLGLTLGLMFVVSHRLAPPRPSVVLADDQRRRQHRRQATVGPRRSLRPRWPEHDRERLPTTPYTPIRRTTPR